MPLHLQTITKVEKILGISCKNERTWITEGCCAVGQIFLIAFASFGGRPNKIARKPLAI